MANACLTYFPFTQSMISLCFFLVAGALPRDSVYTEQTPNLIHDIPYSRSPTCIEASQLASGQPFHKLPAAIEQSVACIRSVRFWVCDKHVYDTSAIHHTQLSSSTLKSTIKRVLFYTVNTGCAVNGCMKNSATEQHLLCL